MEISRYEEEFVELEEIASGTFGKVKVARHRLDGMVYAIKVRFYCTLQSKQERSNQPHDCLGFEKPYQLQYPRGARRHERGVRSLCPYQA